MASQHRCPNRTASPCGGAQPVGPWVCALGQDHCERLGGRGEAHRRVCYVHVNVNVVGQVQTTMLISFQQQ